MSCQKSKLPLGYNRHLTDLAIIKLMLEHNWHQKFNQNALKSEQKHKLNVNWKRRTVATFTTLRHTFTYFYQTPERNNVFKM